ncbi:MAG: hypothetical protein OXT09_36860 [Myxococcales bacterium]|nr:hypothetical protein [Myxococcales bacterium]
MVVHWRTLALAAAVLGAASACSSTTTGNGDDSSEGDGGSNDSSGDGDGDGDGDDSSDTTSGDGDSGGTTVVNDEDDTEPVGDDLVLLFNPMYSAYDGVHDFKLPAIVQGVQDVKWSANPADMVDLAPDSSTGGILITTRKPGTVQIIARTGALSGSAELHITDATPEDWEIGEMRYNNEIPFPMLELPDGGFMGGFDGGAANVMLPDDLSCRNCHSSLATALDVEHTPQQTGGYSDEELIGIFTMGTKPEDAGFHTPFPESIYTRFHTWEATEEEQKGIVIYLRSLEPKTQGPLDFAGLMEQFGGGN